MLIGARRLKGDHMVRVLRIGSDPQGWKEIDLLTLPISRRRMKIIFVLGKEKGPGVGREGGEWADKQGPDHVGKRSLLSDSS